MVKTLSWLRWCAVWMSVILGVSCSEQSQQDPFQYKIAILGNPANPDVRYDTAQLAALRDLGFNALQLNIAWGARPADEPLNLEDIFYVPGIGDSVKVAARLQKMQQRAAIASQWGFRTIFHFGAPRVDSLYKILTPELIDIATEKNSIRKPEIIAKYVTLLQRLKKAIPELDDIQIYTFDQDAWVGSEFGNGPSDRDIPLHERIPLFLSVLTEAWAQVSPEGMVWWEPWEISAGEIYASIPSLPKEHFGMFLHSNIAEVQLTRPVDVWFKNTVRLCAEQGIPVVGEIFMASANEELEPLTHVAAPRLVAEELDAVGGVAQIAGVKEYFGLTPDLYDPNTLMAGLKLKHWGISIDEALAKLAEPFGEAAAPVLKGWEASAVGLSTFPWDATWRFRRLTINPAGIEVYHKWDLAHIEGAVAPSPSWKSTRRSLFMTTETESLDPWFFEDIELRSATSARKLKEAIASYDQALLTVQEEPYVSYLKANKEDLQRLEQMVTAVRCYCREANLTHLMRKYVAAGEKIPQSLIDRFDAIMKIDIVNQEKGYAPNAFGNRPASEMLALFHADPVSWVSTYLPYR
ncbi:MAG: hypothetical protein PHV49_01220 [Alistipes sp.]|nr:hypothetical protein [Alistipes sp.]